MAMISASKVYLPGSAAFYYNLISQDGNTFHLGFPAFFGELDVGVQVEVQHNGIWHASNIERFLAIGHDEPPPADDDDDDTAPGDDDDDDNNDTDSDDPINDPEGDESDDEEALPCAANLEISTSKNALRAGRQYRSYLSGRCKSSECRVGTESIKDWIKQLF